MGDSDNRIINVNKYLSMDAHSSDRSETFSYSLLLLRIEITAFVFLNRCECVLMTFIANLITSPFMCPFFPFIMASLTMFHKSCDQNVHIKQQQRQHQALLNIFERTDRYFDWRQ